MQKIQILSLMLLSVFLAGTAMAAQRGVSEISEGTIRTTYLKTPLVGAKGYVVGDWENEGLH